MGKSTNMVLSINKLWKMRSSLKYGKKHTFTTPKITLTRRNINKLMIDSYRTIWNTFLRLIDRYGRKHSIFFQNPPSIIPSAPINNYRGVAFEQDAVFVSDCTANNRYADLFESFFTKITSNNFVKAFDVITKSNNRKKYYAFDLQIDTSNLPRITKLNCDNGEKTRNTSLFKQRRFGSYNRRKCTRIFKRRIHIKIPIFSKIIEPSLGKRRKNFIEEFSPVNYDYSKNVTQLKSLAKNVKFNKLTNLESIIKEPMVHNVESSRNIKYKHSESMISIIRSNFAVHSFIPNPICLPNLQKNILKHYKNFDYNTFQKCSIHQYGEQRNKLDRDVYNNCLHPINNMNIKRHLSNFSAAKTFIKQNKIVNIIRFVSTITSKKLFSSPKIPITDKYMLVTEKQLRSNPSIMPDPPKIRYFDTNQNNDYIKYNESMLMAAGNENQFLSLMNKLKQKINHKDEIEMSRLNAISKQLEQIRNEKKVLNLYIGEENFKTNLHYQPDEPKYELNCASSKYLKASPARILEMKNELKKESIIPSRPPRWQSLLRLPKIINGNIDTSRTIQELNSTASHMFQSSLKNTNLDNIRKTQPQPEEENHSRKNTSKLLLSRFNKKVTHEASISKFSNNKIIPTVGTSLNVQYRKDTNNKNILEEQKLPNQKNNIAINFRKNYKSDEPLQNNINIKHLKLKRTTMTESVMKESTSKIAKNISTEQKEKDKSTRNILQHVNDPKPSVSYTINLNKTAMVKEHPEGYSKSYSNIPGEKQRKEINSMDIIQEPTLSITNKKLSNEYKMNIAVPENENTGNPIKSKQKTKSVNKSIQTQKIKPKLQKSASFVVSNVKHDKSINLDVSFNLPHTSRKTSKKENILSSEIEILSKKSLMGPLPRFIDLHDIEKNLNKDLEERSFNNKMNNSKKLVIDDFESAFGYSTSTSKTSKKKPQKVTVTPSQITKLIDKPPSMYSPLIARKINKVGASSVKGLHHNQESRNAVNKVQNDNSIYKSQARDIMSNKRRLRAGEDRINSTLERLLAKTQNLTRNLQNIRSQCQEYVQKLEKYNFENTCSCDSLQCTCNDLNLDQNVNNELIANNTRKHIPKSSIKRSYDEFQNPCMEGPFSDILTRHFLPGNKGKMPAIVGYKSDGIPIYGPPGAAYNVMGWTRDGSPIFGRGGPGSKDPLLNIRGYFKSTPLYEPVDIEEKNKITQIGTYDNTPITGHRDLMNGMVFIGKGDKGFGKYKVWTKTQRHSNAQSIMATASTTSERESVDSEEMKKALNSFISNEPVKSMTPRTSVQASKSKIDKPKVYSLSYRIGNIRCNKYHKKCISTKYRSCSSVRKINQKYIEPRRHFYSARSVKWCSFKPEVLKDKWTHKPGEIMKPVARTIKMHRRRLGLQNPERLLKKLFLLEMGNK